MATLARDKEFRVVGKETTTVGLPRPIELKGLESKFRIKPWTDKYERSYLEADVKAALSSLREVK